MSTKKVLDVVKVGFSHHTGDNRSPESLPFPACLTSLVQSLGEDYPIITIHAHNRDYTQRTANTEFMAATGMAFGLLWHPEHCMSSMDLTQVNPHEETISRGFGWAGYAFEVIERTKDNEPLLRARIVDSIDRGVPVLAFGIIGPPECLIITGYDGAGETLIGWSHFQDFEACETEPNGMFRKSGWHDDLWEIVIPGEKIGRTLSVHQVLRHGLEVMQKTESDGYLAGLAAHDAWIQMILGLGALPDDEIRARHKFHNHLVGNLAEARCWGGDFLTKCGATDAGQCFKQIHDLCWKVWGVLGDTGWQGLKAAENRESVAALLSEIKALDMQAMRHLSEYTQPLG